MREEYIYVHLYSCAVMYACDCVGAEGKAGPDAGNTESLAPLFRTHLHITHLRIYADFCIRV